MSFPGSMSRFLFQSTLPRGERHAVLPVVFPVDDFNPRSREGSDRRAQRMSCSYYYFNPRSREGSDAVTDCKIDELTRISIHAPARGATSTYAWKKMISGFQSTLPRGERLFTVIQFIYKCYISIHAPARGATIYA